MSRITSPCPSWPPTDGVAAGEAVECFNPNAAVMRAEALSPEARSRRRGGLQRTGDPATGDFGDATVIWKFRRRTGRSERAVKPSRRVQLFKSNWMRSLSAIVSIISSRSASGGPSVMTRTFQESSWARPRWRDPSATRRCLPSPA